jgi:hypothetical protein
MGFHPFRFKERHHMKNIIILAAFGLIASAHAQYIVYDPTMNTQQIINQAENIAKYAEMIGNQVQQINTLTSQLQQLERYNAAFGNPAAVLQVTGVNGLIADLEHPTVGQAMIAIQVSANGEEALNNNGNGLYHNVGETFTTPSGQQIIRNTNYYRPNAAIDGATQNYTNVYADVQKRRAALKAQIATTTTNLQASTTDAETQKLNGVLSGLNGALAATDKEADQAVGLTLVQQAENQNDKDKQVKAESEEQQADFTESIQNYGTTFKLSAEAPSFADSQ